MRGIEHVEERGQVHAEVRAIVSGPLFQVVLELTALENTRVFREHAKQQAHEQNFKLVARVSRFRKLIVEFAQPPYGLDIDRVFQAEGTGLVTGDESEKTDFFVKVRQWKLVLLVRVQVVKSNAGKIRDRHVMGQVSIFQPGEIIRGLVERTVQVFAERFVLDKQNAPPKQIDKSPLAAFPLHRDFE